MSKTVTVSLEQLKKWHRDFDACQKAIWLAGCRPRVPNGFDPAYCEDAQACLAQMDAVLAEGAKPPLPHPDTARLDFMLLRCRKVTVERGPDDHEIYVEEGFMSDKRYPSITVTGDWESKSAAAAQAKRHAIDMAMAEGK